MCLRVCERQLSSSLQQWELYSMSVTAVYSPLHCLLYSGKWYFPVGKARKWSINCTFLWDGFRLVCSRQLSIFSRIPHWLHFYDFFFLLISLAHPSSIFFFFVSVSSHLWIPTSLKGWNVLVNSCCSIWRHNNNSHLTNMEWEHQSETKHSAPQVMGHFGMQHVGSRRLTDTRHHCLCLCCNVPQ